MSIDGKDFESELGNSVESTVEHQEPTADTGSELYLRVSSEKTRDLDQQSAKASAQFRQSMDKSGLSDPKEPEILTFLLSPQVYENEEARNSVRTMLEDAFRVASNQSIAVREEEEQRLVQDVLKNCHTPQKLDEMGIDMTTSHGLTIKVKVNGEVATDRNDRDNQSKYGKK